MKFIRNLKRISMFQRATVFLIAFTVLLQTSLVSIDAESAPVMLHDLERDIYETTLLAIKGSAIGAMRVEVDLTGYSSTPDQTDDSPFITAANTEVRDGIVATNFLPLHTKIQIPELFGDKIFVVEDRMNRRYTDRVDIWFPTRVAARSFGFHDDVQIVILEVGAGQNLFTAGSIAGL